MERGRLTPWLSFPPAAMSHARGIAFCLPYAGGGASFYRPWAQFVPPSIAICAVQLPGREERMFEQPFDRIAPLVDAAATALLPVLPDRYVLFGHSMGALVCYELAQTFRERGATPPLRLFVSASPAPHRAAEVEPIYDLPDTEFIPALGRYGGLPDEVLASPELLDLILPRLRADLAVTGTYVWEPRPPLSCPITAFSGAGDTTVDPDAVKAWQEHTTGAFDFELFPGGHFFLTAVIRHIAGRIVAAFA